MTAPVDQSLLAALRLTAGEATAALQAYDHAGALEAAERFFWMFCDDYLELVKARAYAADSPGGASARGALRLALDVLLRMFAPFLPFVSEEVWSWWREGSVHQAPWPAGGARGIDTVAGDAAGGDVAGGDAAGGDAAAGGLAAGDLAARSGSAGGDPAVLATAAAVLGEVRKAKSAAKRSMRAEAERVVVRGPDESAVRAAEADLRAAGNIADFAFQLAPGGELRTEVTLAEAVPS